MEIVKMFSVTPDKRSAGLRAEQIIDSIVSIKSTDRETAIKIARNLNIIGENSILGVDIEASSAEVG